jgi:galactose-1-phosphate uridylyltransferase
MRFVKHVQSSTLHNPLLGGKVDTQQIEIRRDPLTGHQAAFNPRLTDKVAMFYGATDYALVERLARESEARCFLCGEKWRETTPTYPEALVPGGRIQVGDSILFPNLFPIAQVHAVIRVGARHFLPLPDFQAATIRDAFSCAMQLVRRLSSSEPSARFLTLCANYLGPAGASIAHPHFQLVGGDLPCTWLEQALACGKAYAKEIGSCYWTDLLATEKQSPERYLGRTGTAEWITAFSPAGANEVQAILPQRRHFLELNEADLAGLADGLAKVLAGYHAMGISTFNFAIYSGELGTTDDGMRCLLRIVSRQNVYENYRADDYFLQKLLRNELILTPPEVLAATLRQQFT